MFTADTEIRVRYGETDQMGYVYYGNYALYYEVGRVEALRQLGTSYRALEESGVMLPVMELKSRFIKPARYDDLLVVKTTIKEMPTARIIFYYEIFNQQKELLHTAWVSLVFVDMKSNRPTRCAAVLEEALKPFFEER